MNKEVKENNITQSEERKRKFRLKDFFGNKKDTLNQDGKTKEDILSKLGLDGDKVDEKKLLKNKDLLLSFVDGQIINYTDFIKQSEKIKIGKKRILKMLAEAKKDFDDGKEQIEFKIRGSKEVKFGNKLNIEDVYTIINKDFEEDIIEYFTKQMKLKTKDKEIKESFPKLIEEHAKKVIKEKFTAFNVGTAAISMKIEPVSNIFTLEIKTLGVNKNIKIDLSK